MKDPAFLFYSSDFLTGTALMTDDQIGKYIKLLCFQHQKGRLSEKDMLKICFSHDEDIFEKFKQDGAGMYFNERLESESEKRKRYSESRSENRKKKIAPEAKPEKAPKVIKPEPQPETEFSKAWASFLEMRKAQRKPATPRAIELLKEKLRKLSGTSEPIAVQILNQSIVNNWQDLFPLRDNKIAPQTSTTTSRASRRI